MVNLVGVTGADENVLLIGSISIEPNLDPVFSWRQIQSLKGPVEVVDCTGMNPVHINLSFMAEFIRLYLDPDGTIIGGGRPVAISVIGAVFAITISS